MWKRSVLDQTFQSRWRRSSPGTYSRCCTNSTEWPKTGLLCMPEMKPSTTCRARRSSRVMRAIVSGCRKRRGSSAVVATRLPQKQTHHKGTKDTKAHKESKKPVALALFCLSFVDLCVLCAFVASFLRSEDFLETLVFGEFPFAGGRFFQQLLDHRIGGHAFGGGGEVGQDAVPEYGIGQ